jgi:hypothetical protein
LLRFKNACMNTQRDCFDKITSDGLPAWTPGGAGIVLLLIALKVARSFLKFVFVILALTAFVGAGWWHSHPQAGI